MIEDEVLKITTLTAADQKMTTRVYPVADLVIPIPSAQMGGGQQGAGGGQQGGGFGGQGGGAAGGGVFSVPPEKVPAKAQAPKDNAPAKVDNQTIDALKKKRDR